MDLDLSDLLQHINEIMEGGQGGVGRLGRDGAATRQASEDKRPHAAPPPDIPFTCWSRHILLGQVGVGGMVEQDIPG